MEYLIKRDLNNLESLTKGGGDDSRLVEQLGEEVIRLRKSHRELKDRFDKLDELVKKCTLSRKDYVTRLEWEEFQKQVEKNTAKAADFEQSTDAVMRTMGDLLVVIGEQTGEKSLSFASSYIKMANQLRKTITGFSGPAGTSKGGVEH